MNHDELADDRQLDPEELDINALAQADLYGKWAERSAIAKALEERLEWEVEKKEAELQGRIRKYPAQFGLESSTEAAVKAAVRVHKEYITAKEKYLDARAEAMLLDRAERSLDQRKRMIEELVKLHGQQYFAGPKMPRDIISAWQAHRVAREEATGDRLRGKTRKRVRTEGEQS